ncbi:rCG20452 [Rattus norvegicus]|uniref:RCG20452 n=1 Tax=Rattus norvegicus TaxID=10116 RepID=A6JGK8_RAT|nr:rCG20452 [Rattus norvegicus]
MWPHATRNVVSIPRSLCYLTLKVIGHLRPFTTRKYCWVRTEEQE